MGLCGNFAKRTAKTIILHSISIVVIEEILLQRNTSFMELDGGESKWCVKVDAYEIFIYPLGEMSHIAMLHLNWRGFCLLKFLFEINFNQIAINSLVFR